MFTFFKNHQSDVIKFTLLVLAVIALGIFIVFNTSIRNFFNRAQVIDLGGPLNDEAVLPSLLSTGFDTGAGTLFDTSNADIRNIFTDTGINMLRFHPGVTSNYAHHNGPGMGLIFEENEFWNSDGTKDTEMSYSTTFNGSNGNPFTRFYDKYIDLAQNIRRPVITYSLNVVTQSAVGLVAPVPIDTASINLAISESLSAIQGFIDQGIVVEGVQLCSECGPNAPSRENGQVAFPDVNHFIARVHPIALAIQNSYPDIRIQLHAVVPNPNQVDYGVSSSWNAAIRSAFADIDKLDIGAYLWTDGFVNTDEVCDPANNQEVAEFDIFACFRDRAREMLDVHVPNALDAYTSYFGPDRGFRATQININNYDQSTINPQFSTAAFENTFANAATMGELLFKIAEFNDDHNNIVKSASLMSFSGSLKNLVSKTKPNTNDSTIPADELYGSYYTQNSLKLNAAGLAYKIIKPVFDGFHDVLDVIPTFPANVPIGQAQLYGFTDLNSGEDIYFIFNWSNKSIPLSAISFDAKAINDPGANITLTEVYGQKLSSTYGRADERNTDAFTPIIDGDPVSFYGTDTVVLKPFSITRIEGLELEGEEGEDKTAPSIPTNPAIVEQTSSSATLAWDPSVDDSGEVEEYTVYQIINEEGNEEGKDDVGIGGSTNCVTSNGNDTGTLRYCNEIFAFSEVSKNTYQYATAPDGDNTELFLDLYLPPNESNERLPLAFNLHGGGGDKADSGWCKDFTMRGWACASINYRGAGGGNFNNANQILAGTDLAAAVRWARANAGLYNFDKNRIVATGTSAGGLTSFTANMLGNNMNNVAITSDARVSLSNMSEPSWICSAAGHPGGVTMTMLNTFLDANDGPMHDYHGEDDATLDYTLVKSAFDQIMTVIPSTFTHWPDTGHKVGHADEIIPDIFSKLYADVIVGGCPQSYSNITKILN